MRAFSTVNFLNLQEGDGGYRAHKFVMRTFNALTKCSYCSAVLYGVVRQGMSCEGTTLLPHKHLANTSRYLTSTTHYLTNTS